MSGESDLATLLKTLEVIRHDGEWRFETQAEHPDPDQSALAFRESEGWTAILPAGQSTPPDNRWVWLEMSVHSDLNAVGFLAAIANALAGAGVPCNAVAGFYHDHVFVPEGKADVAVKAIEALANQD